VGTGGFIYYLHYKAEHAYVPNPDVKGGACNNTADNSTILKVWDTLHG